MTLEAAAGMKVAGHVLPADIVATLQEASQATGVDFRFLVAQASVESGFQGDVRSRRSSAAGLFQFTGQTWLQMMQRHGARYGQAELAQAIRKLPDGRLGTGNAATDQQILELRKDVRLAAIFAGELAKENAGKLQKVLGGPAGAADLHLAHLLGAAGAIRFLKAREADAGKAAASVVPAAARQNPTLFYDRGGPTPKSVAAVYRNVKNTIETPLRQVAAVTGGAPVQIAASDGGDGLRPGVGLTDAPPRRYTGGA